jgi:hypothetical protein
MPRKSISDLTLVRAKAPGTPLPAPGDLEPAEAALWRDIVASKPADWFGGDCAPLLKEYVRSARMCDLLAPRISAAIGTVDPRGLKRLLDLRHQESTRAAMLATKLRLTQQSRYSARAAASADRRAAGARPWQAPHDA